MRGAFLASQWLSFWGAVCLALVHAGSGATYSLELVARTGGTTRGGNTIAELGSGPSINDSGKVAYQVTIQDGRQGIIVSDEPVTRTSLIDSFPVGFFTFHDLASAFYFPPTVQLNNQDQIGWRVWSRDGLFSFIFRLGTTAADYQVVAKGRYDRIDTPEEDLPSPYCGPILFPAGAVSSAVSLNNGGRTVFSGLLCGTPNQYLLATPRDLAGSFHDALTDYHASPTLANTSNFFPRIADNDAVVVRGGRPVTAPIMLFPGSDLDPNNATFLATSPEYDVLGERPAISDDGRVVAFMAVHASQGPGIYAAVIGPNQQVTAGPFRITDSAEYSAFFEAAHVGVNRSRIDSMDRYSVAFLARIAGVGQEVALHVVELDIAQPTAPRVSPAIEVLRAGEIVPGLADPVAFIDMYDSINNQGDLTFWVSTATQRAIVKARALSVVPIQAVFNPYRVPGHEDAFALVAGKNMVLRIFFDTGPGGPETMAEALVCLEGDVDTCPQETLLMAEGRAYPSGHSFTVEQRRNAKNSLNVFVAGEDANRLLTPGRRTLSVQIRPKNAGAFPIARQTIECVFLESAQLNVYVLPVSLLDETGQPVGPEDSPAPGMDSADAELLARSMDFVTSVYPLDEERLRSVNLPRFDLSKPGPFGTVEFREAQDYFKKRLLAGDQRLKDLYEDVPEERNIVMVVVNNVIGNDNRPLGEVDGASILGFTIPGQPPPLTVVSLDRFPSGDPSLARPDTVVIGSTAAHEIGHLFGFDEGYYDQDSDEAHPNLIDEKGTPAGFYINEDEQAFDVGGLRPLLAELDGNSAMPGAGPSAVFVTLDTSLDPLLPFPDPIAGGPVYGYMGGTGRSGVSAGLGLALEGGGDTRAWTRQTEYQRLYPQLTKTMPSAGAMSLASVQPRTVVLLSGIVSQTDEASLEPPFVSQSGLNFSRPQGTGYVLRFSDPDGTSLEEVEFGLEFTQRLGPDGERSTTQVPFSYILDMPADTRVISLMKDGTVLAFVERSANAPEVQILSATLEAGSYSVHWEGLDPDGDTLRYMILYSPDGVSRFVLASDITSTNHTGSLENLPAPEGNASITVRVDDGFGWAEDVLIVAPSLSVGISEGEVILSWLLEAEGFRLEGATSLRTPISWAEVTNHVAISGNRYEVRVERTTESQFFQLRKP